MSATTDIIVKHIECTSAVEFLDLLSPRGKLFGTHQRRDKAWAYRGHRDDSFELVPVALREHEREELFQLAGLSAPVDRDNLSQFSAEVAVLDQFKQDCDESGLVVPGYGSDLDRSLQQYTGYIKSKLDVSADWPDLPVIPALCLAQHHGLPTRLLDWSYSSFKAAHFAATDATRLPHRSDKFSVWALRLSALLCMRPISAAKKQNRVEVIAPPRCDNTYLCAQEGLFTLCRVHAFGDGDTLDVRPLNEQIEEYDNRKPYEFNEFPVFYHLTLEHAEAAACLRGLEKESITTAALFPDYRGVVQAMRDSVTLRQP